MRGKILIVDDEASARYGIRRALEKEGYEIFEAENLSEAQKELTVNIPQVVLLDVRLANESGLDFLPDLVSIANPPLVIVMTAHGSEKLAVEVIKKGAYNYLAKPFDIEELRLVVSNAFETFSLRQENATLRKELSQSQGFGNLIGSSNVIQRVYSLIEKVAQTSVSVLITGESGTGKEMVAREIHRRSTDRKGPFVAINCAAMPEQLIESELFGHEKGSFTGANVRRIGKFEAANHGTLFLDEIGDMSLVTQAKVLRILEDKSFQRLGSNESISTDVRIISATNKDLEKEIEQTRFRSDLYYRLCVVTIQLPPLSERKEDIIELIHHFCKTYSVLYKKEVKGVSTDALKALLSYPWPGNIRQLKNLIERAVVLSDSEEITLNELPDEMTVKQLKSNDTNDFDHLKELLLMDFTGAKKEFEKLYIENCLMQTSGNITQAAAIIGIHRQSLQHKIKELGLTKRFVIDRE